VAIKTKKGTSKWGQILSTTIYVVTIMLVVGFLWQSFMTYIFN
jgi:hypothetical protein